MTALQQGQRSMWEQRLLWVQKNHRGRLRVDALSKIVGKFRGSPRLSRLSRQCSVVDIVEQQMGVELVNSIEWIEQRGTTLILWTKDTASCYTLGIRWRQSLGRVLQAQAPGSGIREVRFLPADKSQW